MQLTAQSTKKAAMRERFHRSSGSIPTSGDILFGFARGSIVRIGLHAAFEFSAQDIGNEEHATDQRAHQVTHDGAADNPINHDDEKE